MSASIEELRAAWDRVVATRDASPPDCACREATGPLIDAWVGRITVRMDPAEIARCASDLRRAQAAQAGARLLPDDEDEFILDVRTPAECEEGPRAGAVNIPVDDLQLRIGEVPTDRPIVVFCKTGLRAARAAHLLRAAGRRACNGHAETCPVPWGDAAGPNRQSSAELRAELPILRDMLDRMAAVGKDRRLGAFDDKDPILEPVPTAGNPLDARLGAAADPGILSGLLGDAGKSAGSGIGEAARAAVPGIGDAVRAEIPKTAATAGDAARAEVPGVVQAAKPAAEEAGEAAGRGVARGARGEASTGWGFGARLVAGLAALGALAGIGYAVFGGEKKGRTP